MAPKKSAAAKQLEKDIADKQGKKEAKARAALAEKEQEARNLAASIERGPSGPPPFWILDSAAKVRDPQCHTYLRQRACKKIQDSMAEAKPYVSFFAGALSCAIVGDAEEEVQCAAVSALGALAEVGVPYTDSLTFAVLNDKSAAVRSAAVRSLGLICRSPQRKAAEDMCSQVFLSINIEEEAEKMISQWKAEASKTAVNIAQMEQLNQMEQELLSKNRDIIISTREIIVDAFGSMPKKYQASLRNFMKAQHGDISKEDRRVAAEKLCRNALRDLIDNTEVFKVAVAAFDVYMAEALPALQTYCNSILYKSDRVKLKAALDVLLPVAMSDSDFDVRQSATEALCELKCSTEPMFEALAGTLEHDGDAIKRLRAASAFASFIRVSDTMAAETLQQQGHAIATAAMHDAVPGVRQAAARALGSNPTGAEPFVEDLISTLKTGETADARKGAARALGAIGDVALPRIRELFVALLEDSDFAVRYWSTEALGLMGDPATVYISALAAVALYDVDTHMRTRANDALGTVGKLAGPVVDEFTVVRDDEEQARQERAANALDEVGVPHKGLVKDESLVAGRKGGRKTTRGDRKPTSKEKALLDATKTPLKASRDFECDVGQFLSDLNKVDEDGGVEDDPAALESTTIPSSPVPP